MLPIEIAWVTGPPLATLAGISFFMKRRQKTKDYADFTAFKANLPWWVKNIETLMAIVSAAVLATFTFKLYALLSGSPPFKTLDGPAAAYVVLGIGSITLPVAFLCANAFSWVVPVLRRANDRALRGNDISFRTANSGLIKAAMISIPIGVIALCAAAIQPWH